MRSASTSSSSIDIIFCILIIRDLSSLFFILSGFIARYPILFLISESSAIADCKNSMGVISNETIVANHPWVDDVQGELDRLAAEKEENLDLYGGFGQNVPPDDEPPDDKNE